MNQMLARNVLAALAADLRGRAAAEPAVLPFAERLARVDCSVSRFESPVPLAHPLLDQLRPALAAAEGSADLLAATRAVASAVSWYQIYQGAGLDPALARGMLAGQIAGQAGIVASDELRAGIFLLAPGIHYPPHTHAAEEIYYCLSGRLTLQHGLSAAPFELTPGRLSVTPSNRLHSLTIGSAPVLMLYAWIGVVDSPNWWWAQAPGGGWRRACWERQPDGSWAPTVEEPVTAAQLAEAEG